MADTLLVLIPFPGAGHFFPAVELAKKLVSLDDCLSVVVLVQKFPFDHSNNDSAPSVDTARVRFIHLPQENTFSGTTTSSFIFRFIESNKPNVTHAVAKLVSESASPPRRLVGFVLDLFCTTMIDVADSFGVPSYVFIASSAAFLGLTFYMQEQTDRHGKNMVKYKDTDEEIDFPGFVRPFPAKVLPSIVLLEETAEPFLDLVRRYRETKGIIVNTFLELEENALKFLRSEPDIPKVYPVGPLLNLCDDTKKNPDTGRVLKWLDEQPPVSVVFLCFGSMGSFGKDQVREIAIALEKSGHRFLWSLRRPLPKEKVGRLSDYGEDLTEVLPEGFLDRTARIGRVIGWAPQAQVLAHPSTGGFVSHCGWNSTLESIWFGVPMATWPLYAEQQFNAFYLARELGVAVEIRIEYRKDFFAESTDFVLAEEIERGIRELMEEQGLAKRKKLNGISTSSRDDDDDVIKLSSSSLALLDLINDFSYNSPTKYKLIDREISHIIM